MFMLVSWFGLTLPLLNAADWFRLIRLLKRLFVSSHLSEVIYVWCYCRSEERFSRNAETDIVCRLLLEKKKQLDVLEMLDPTISELLNMMLRWTHVFACSIVVGTIH